MIDFISYEKALIKNIQYKYKVSLCFRKVSRRNLKVELNYATKGDLKEGTNIDTTNLAAIFDLAGLKVLVDKTDKDKLISCIMMFSKNLYMIN